MGKTNLWIGAAVLTVVGFLAGCGVTAHSVRANMTPELDHTARSHQQAANDHARIIDNNTRGIWDDVDRLLLLDHNSRLTPYSVP